MDYRKLKYDYEKFPEEVTKSLIEGIKTKDANARPADFSIRQLGEALVGREWIDSLNPANHSKPLLEAGSVQLSDFSSITGQIVFSAILDGYESDDFIFSKLVPKTQSMIPDIERIPGISNIGDNAEVVDEMKPYPYVGVSEDYIDIAAKKKRGLIVPVSKEAIFFDRTGVLLDRCRDTGTALGYNKEKRIIDCIIDENAGAASILAGGHRYHWKGTSYALYQTSTPWVNSATSNPLVDWNNVQTAWLQLSQILDPYTGEPVPIQPTDLICAPQLEWTAKRVVNATTVRVATPGFATTGNPTQTEANNPVPPLTIRSSRLLYARMGTKTTWYTGNIAKGFKYFYNWDLETMEAASNSAASFERDIVAQYRVDERGTIATVQPRVMQKNAA